ncbi:MAG TPA: hypothetical protein VN799_09425 [Acidimicrobiales bacterium]|nr:hypothetical protein [Acidimicrobiales bacterium]
MRIFDTLLGRTKPVRANLDALFALPSAAVTLQVSAGLVSTGKAGVCFKPPSGQNFTDMQTELEKLLELGDPAGGDATSAAPSTASADSAPSAGGASTVAPTGGTAPASPAHSLMVRHVGDRFGYRWILVEGGEIDDLVTRVHMVHSSLEDAGWSPQLLCSVFGFAPTGTPDDTPGDGSVAITQPIFLVYLAKQGTFYPFAPQGNEQRDTELELRVRSILGTDLPIETDLSRWFPIWDLPVA